MLPTKKHQTWLPSIINDFIGNEWLSKTNETSPSVNIIECEKRYKVEIATPGMTKDDFSIEIHSDNHLVVTMEKSCECTDDHSSNREDKKEKKETAPCECAEVDNEHNGKYLRREFSYSQFKQTLILPDNIDKSKISAEQVNGILTISLPKKESVIEAQAVKKIPIK